MFDKIREFLDTNDVYNSQELIDQHLVINFEKPKFLDALNKILDIYKLTEVLGEKVLMIPKFDEVMKAFTEEFIKLVECIRIFASNNEEYDLISRLQFILTRGFR